MESLGADHLPFSPTMLPRMHDRRWVAHSRKAPRKGPGGITARREILGRAGDSEGQDSFLYHQEQKGTLWNNFPGKCPWVGRSEVQAMSQTAPVSSSLPGNKHQVPVIF